MRRTFKITAMLVIILAIALGQLPQLEAQAADDTVRIDMKVGFDKFYKIGYSTPVNFEIENKLRDINGELQIEMPNQSETITLYAMNVSLPKDSTKKFVMNVPTNMFNTKLTVNLVEGKSTVMTKTFRVDPGSNMETFVIGILSDDFDSVKYINRVTMKSLQSLSAKNVKLDEDNFPDDIDVLKAFNVIVINNFDTSRLSKLQYETLKNWVSDGGSLVIGTGPSQNKTLSIFKDDFVSGEIGEISTIQTMSLQQMAGNNKGEVMSLNIADVAIKGSKPIIKEGNTVLLQKIDKGRGTIAVAAFDFGLEPLSSWISNSAFADKALVSILPDYYVAGMSQKGMVMQENAYAIDNALRNIPELPLPKTSHLVFLYIAYILLAAPISYFVLKRMDRRELMWLTVPVLSLAFTGIIFVSGVGTRLTEPITNVISLVDIDNSGVIAPKTYAGVFTPNKDSIRIEAGENLDIRPIVLNNGYYMRGPMPNDNTKKRVDSKVIVAPKTILEFYKNGVWSMRTLQLETDTSISGKLESSLNYAKGAFTGTVKNTSGFDLDECYIITSNQYADIGPIKNGETKQINVKPNGYFGHRYDLINAIYKDPYNVPQPQPNQKRKKLTAEEISKSRQDMQKRQVLEYSFMNESNQGFEAKLMAWSSTPISKGLLVNSSSTKSYEKSLITAQVDMSFRDGNNVEYPFGYLKPTVVNNMSAGNYDEFGKMFYGRGSFEIHYEIDNKIALESIKTQYTIGNTQRVRQYIWDTEKGDWVEGDYRSFDIYGGLLEKYIDGNNMLKLKIEMDEDNVQLPQITVKGSVK